MEQSKASLEKFFLIQLSLLLSLVNNLILNSKCTVTFIVWSVLTVTLTLKVSKANVLNICVKLSLVTCLQFANHFFIFIAICLTGKTGHSFVMYLVFQILTFPKLNIK